jgi:uncharacterized protein
MTGTGSTKPDPAHGPSPDRSPRPTQEMGQSAGSPRPAPADPICGDFDIRIGRDGTWYYHGSPIGRKPLVRLFASVLRREEDGGYWLVTPVERGRIVVDDVPFVAVALDAEGSGREQTLTFRTNIDDEVTADAAHPLRVETNPGTAEPSPYILVRPGLEARLLRPVFYQLVALGESQGIGGEDVYGVWSKGQFFPLGRLDPSA